MMESTTNVNLIAVDFDPFAGPAIVRLAPSTEPQREIWTTCQFGDDANRSFNESVSLRLHGPLNHLALEQAWQALTRRHEALHAAFSADGKQICIFDELPVALQYDDYSTKNVEEREQAVAEYVKHDAFFLFDLLNGPLVKAGLIKLADNEHHFTLTGHHIVCDGWSLGILLQELSVFYSAYAQHITLNLPPAPLYSEYALEQRRFAETAAYQQVERFWVDQYRESVPVLDLPTDFIRPTLRTYKINRKDYPLSSATATAVKQMGLKAGCSFVTTLLTAFEVFLYRLTGQNDIVVGLPTAGQSATDNPGLIGHCVNLLPLRSFPKGTQNFVQFLKQRKEAVLDAYDNQQLTFNSLLKKLTIARDASRVPLVPVIFNVDMGLDNGVNFFDLTYQLISNPRQYGAVDLFVNISDASTGDSSLIFEWSYNTQLFRDDTIDRMMAEFERLLDTIVATPSVELDQIPLTDLREQRKKLTAWNNTAADYPRNTPLHELLAQTAAKFPDKTALVVAQKTLTYRQLTEAANQAAHVLRRSGIGTGDVVGVMLDRSPDLLIALLAVLKAGAAYLPIDPDYPQDRIAFMLADSSARMVLTSRKYQHIQNAQANSATVTLMETVLTESASYPTEAPAVRVSSDDLAYILYTSGSTGQPKGVMIEHHNLVNLLYSMIAWPGITADDVLLGVTTVSFDIAGLELYLPILVGATLVLADSETTKDGRLLLQAVSEPTRTGQAISIIQATPVTYKMMLASGWEERLPLKILCCGEPMSKDLAQKLIARCDTLWNMYGPTETTIYSTGKQILASDEVITIGRPIQNTQVYILDEHLNPLPEGIVGEIYLAGDGVARGYLNRPELNSAKFVPNPFSASASKTMYRTGDLGKFLANGEIHCLGRIDHQVKIRGYRVELGEIEHALVTQTDIREVVVIAREDRPGDQRLVAYLVPSTPLTEKSFLNQVPIWRKNLLEVLPTYMVPADFVQLVQLPVTPNGKIDRNALPKPTAGSTKGDGNGAEPVSAMEKLICGIWSDVLDIEKISIMDDFFELGGHSMIAVQVMSRLEKETGRRLPLSTLLTYPTVQKLAQLLENDKHATPWKSLVPIKPEGSKMPIYIIHGIGLNLLNFSSLVSYMDPEQPIYGLQALGLDGTDEPLDNMEAIAAFYVSEVVAQNPTGPYAIAGYSFGGYVALEMARLLKAAGKEVKLLAMFDTNAQESTVRYSLPVRVGQKVFRQGPKLVWIIQSLIKHPGMTLDYQWQFVKHLLRRAGLMSELPASPETQNGVSAHLQRIMDKHEMAYENYVMKPYDGIVDLFKAKIRVYFVDDNKYLGWKKYAKGVRVHNVPGDHKMMLLPPNDKAFARALQQALDNC
jgi:amino acid adenylation domain-containing protein